MNDIDLLFEVDSDDGDSLRVYRCSDGRFEVIAGYDDYESTNLTRRQMAMVALRMLALCLFWRPR